MNTPITRLVLAAVAMSLAACKRQEASAKDPPAARTTNSSAPSVVGQGAAAAEAVNAQPANPDPCALVPVEDAKRLLGPLSAAPYRGVSADDTSPSSDGHACMYPLAPRENVADGSVIALELRTQGAIGFEAGAAMIGGRSNSLLKFLGAKSADGALHDVDGWDYVGALTDIMSARVGHVAIHAKWTRARGAGDSLVRVMDIMRDHIPDRPFLSSERESSGSDGDPCSLITRSEAEAVIGKLTVPPYLSHDLTGLADRQGNACSYYTSNHHVLSMKPSWRQGKQLFRLLAGLSQNVESKVGGKGADIDTLEGDWDQRAVAVTGDILLLKGDRLLQVSYRTSTASESEATKLGADALRRLVAAP
jgi:hypothetical protein